MRRTNEKAAHAGESVKAATISKAQIKYTASEYLKHSFSSARSKLSPLFGWYSKLLNGWLVDYE